MPIPFFEAILGEFPPESWSSGLSIFRAGGIRKFEHFEELAQAEIRAGMGEYFDVHIKLHSDGRCIQWMDCSCLDNRRRGLKCGHIAALCIHIDVEEHKFLAAHGMAPVGAEDVLERSSHYQYGENGEKGARSGAIGGFFDDGETLESVRKGSNSGASKRRNSLSPLGIESSSRNPENSENAESVELEPGARSHRQPGLLKGLSLRSLGYSRDPGVLIATVVQPEGREIKYRLGLEDSLALLTWGGSESALSGKLLKEQQSGYFAKRIFRISRNKAGQFQVEKRISIEQSDQVEREIGYDSLPKPHHGRSGVYLRKFGFVSFRDHFDHVQEARWADYPSHALLDTDVAAGLFQTGFERLRQTADVVLSDSVKELKVETAFHISALNVKEGERGGLLVQAEIIGGQGSAVQQDKLTLFQIVSARKQGKQFIETESGWIKIGEEFDWVAPKLDPKGLLHLSKLEFVRFKESVAQESLVIGHGDVVQRLCQGLRSQAEIDAPQIANELLNLRPYQVEGFRWLWWLYENRLGGLLADEMGLGKTHQAMALISGIGMREKNAPPTLVVCPTSVIDHWLDKLQKFVPDTELFSYYGAGRKVIPKKENHFVVVTSYGILLRDIDLICQREWSVVILDEAHLVKNQTTRTYQAACKISSHLRICLTGTPLENDLFELKTLFDYIVPGYLGPDTAFRKKFIQSDAGHDPLAAIELKRLVHPFKLRRTKAEVLADLPEKVEDVRYCQLNEGQRELYEQALRLKGQPILDALTESGTHIPYVHVFAVITFLKQICNDPGLVHDDYEAVSSGKLELFDEILGEALESDQKVVVFSQYARMVGRLSKRLQMKGIKHVCLTGQSNKRGDLISSFQNDPEVKVFIGSLLAGGTGIDLTAASVVIHFDRWWNAAKENQATDRIHRIGQNRNVQVFKLVTRGTLEEHIDQIIERKRLTFEKYVEEDSEAFKNMTRDDLVKLLAPLQTGVVPVPDFDEVVPIKKDSAHIKADSNQDSEVVSHEHYMTIE